MSKLTQHRGGDQQRNHANPMPIPAPSRTVETQTHEKLPRSQHKSSSQNGGSAQNIFYLRAVL